MKAEIRSVLWWVFGCVLSVVILVFLLRRIDIRSVRMAISTAWEISLIMALAVSFCANIILSAWQWRTVYWEMGHRISLFEHIFVKTALYPLRAVMPFRTGDVGRALYMAIHHRVPVACSVAAQGLVLLVNTVILLYCSVIGFILAGSWILASLAACALTALVVGGILARNYLIRFDRPPDDGRWFRKRLHQMHPLVAMRSTALLPIGLLGIVTLMGQVVAFSLIATSFGVILQPNFVFATVPVILLAGGIPLSLMGLGLRESATLAMLAHMAAPDVLLSVGLLFSFVDQIALALFGFIALAPFILACRVQHWPSMLEW